MTIKVKLELKNGERISNRTEYVDVFDGAQLTRLEEKYRGEGQIYSWSVSEELAYDEGYKAALNGKFSEDNPYSGHFRKHDEWRKGYYDSNINLIKSAINNAFKDGKLVVLDGVSGVGKSVLANEILPNSLLEESTIINVMRQGTRITSTMTPIVKNGELVIDEAQLLCQTSDWEKFINDTKSHKMKVLVVSQLYNDLPNVFIDSPDVFRVHLEKPIYNVKR